MLSKAFPLVKMNANEIGHFAKGGINHHKFGAQSEGLILEETVLNRINLFQK